MIFFISSLICSSSIYLIFRYLAINKIKLFQVILINYWVCFLFGIIATSFSSQWIGLNYSVIGLGASIGFLFISLFYAMGLTTQLFGVGTSSIVSRVSLVIPVLYFAIYLNEGLAPLQWLAVAIAVIAVLLTSKKNKTSTAKKIYKLLPIIVFLGYGLIDVLLKYSNQVAEKHNAYHLMTTAIFFFAGLYGFIISLFKQINFSKNELILGLILGLLNYGSIYLLLEAIKAVDLKSSELFAINGVLILLLSNVGAFLLFRDKPTKFQIIGIILAIFSTLILSIFRA